MRGRVVGTGASIEANCSLEFRCPFCKTPTTVHCVEIEGEGSALMHDVPMCNEYDTLEPADFLRAARKRMRS